MKTKILSSLVKVFSDVEPPYQPECNLLTSLKNETVSFQVAYTDENTTMKSKIKIDSPINEYIRIRQVVEVPVNYSCHPMTDDHYLRTKSGLYPDLLTDVKSNEIKVVAKHWKSLWVDIEVPVDSPSGKYPINIIFFNNDNEEIGSAKTNITLLDAILPDQKLIRTEWFHGDCLANYYQVDVFSDKHWMIIKNFISLAVRRGINMILTPQFTPPLDTAKGGERTTIQLIDISLTNGEYTFHFSKLKKWIDLCLEVGVQYFEMSHLFTQWGAIAAPKIMATIDGNYQQLFGWNTPATSDEYTHFLHQYLPQLTSKLKQWGIADRVYFHISDEPKINQLDSYQAAKKIVEDDLKDFIVMDALSNYEFYKMGIVEKPVCSTNHIHSFIDHKVKNLWAYYCTSQYDQVSNRFMSMPSSRNRIYGIQLYKYKIEGALHWGYNFYNSQYSLKQINPYLVTDALESFPAGDSFLVYPKADGTPEESIRIMVLYHAMTDLRALEYLEQLTSKEYVMNLIEGELSVPITFDTYPKSDMYLIALRNRVNIEIIKNLNIINYH